MYAPRFKRYNGFLTLGTSGESRAWLMANQGKSKPPCKSPVEVREDAIRLLKQQGGNIKDKLAVLSATELQFGQFQGKS